MFRCVGLVWNALSSVERTHAGDLCRRLDEWPQWRRVFASAGLAVYGYDPTPRSKVAHMLADGHGVVLGEVFLRPNLDGTCHEMGDFDQSSTRAVALTEGRQLIDGYWGKYVAFVTNATEDKVWVLQEPAASAPLYRTQSRGVRIYFSDLADCTALQVCKFRVDWDYLSASLVSPVLPSACTAISQVAEVLGGQCDEIHNGNSTSRYYWLPDKFAADPIIDSAAAASALKSVITACTHAWAARHPGILLMLSGGLDSSILLACLRKVRPSRDITCLTYYSAGGEGDERQYASLAARAANCVLVERLTDPRTALTPMLNVVESPRPNSSLSCLYERDIAAMTAGVGATAIMTGNGGDAAFGEISDHTPATDYLLSRGMGRRFWSTVLDTAELTQCSIWNVLRAVARDRCNRESPSPILAGLEYRQLVSQHVIAAVRTNPDRYLHPWVARSRIVAPGKRRQISNLSYTMSIRPPMEQVGDPDYVHPLASLPVMEMCLRVPSYVYAQGGISRVVARKAFEKEVPGKIMRRRSKGNPGQLMKGLIAYNRSFLRELLLGGTLVSEGLLDGTGVERALSDRPDGVSPDEIMCHVCTEIWLRQFMENHGVTSTVREASLACIS